MKTRMKNEPNWNPARCTELVHKMKGSRSAKQFSRDTGVDTCTLGQLLRGISSRPATYNTCKKLYGGRIEGCNITFEELLEANDNPIPGGTGFNNRPTEWDPEALSIAFMCAKGDMTNKEFAKLVGVTAPTVGNYINQKTKTPPDLYLLKNVADQSQDPSILFINMARDCGYSEERIRQTLADLESTPAPASAPVQKTLEQPMETPTEAPVSEETVETPVSETTVETPVKVSVEKSAAKAPKEASPALAPVTPAVSSYIILKNFLNLLGGINQEDVHIIGLNSDNLQVFDMSPEMLQTLMKDNLQIKRFAALGTNTFGVWM